MKKIISIMLVSSIILTSSFISDAITVYTRKNCKQTSTGRVCTTEKYMKLSAKYTYAESKKIVDRYKKYGSQNGQIIQFIIGLHPVSGLSNFMYNIGATKSMKYFETAVKKKTGVKFSYDYVLSNNSIALNKVTNLKVSYVK